MISRAWIVVGFALGSSLIVAPVMVARAQTQTKDQARLTAPAVSLISPLAEYSLDRFSATRERPLFSPSRRPPPPPVVAAIPPPPPPPPPSPPNVTVLGIVMGAEEARAIVQIAPANETRRVRVGDDIGGWQVVQIEQRKLVLSLDNDRSATFTMFGGDNNVPKKPAMRREASPASPPPLPSQRRE